MLKGQCDLQTKMGISSIRVWRILCSVSEAPPLFSTLRQSSDADIVAAIEELVHTAPERQLSRVNVLDFASKWDLDEEKTIAAFLHAARLGIFELSWNVLCLECGGVLDTAATLKNVHNEAYNCALCATGYEPTLDERVEVTFTVSSRVRRIAAHDPHKLPQWEFYRQIFWSSGVDLPDDAFKRMIDETILDARELQPGEKIALPLQLPQELVIVFDPVTHSAQYIQVRGEPAKEQQNLSVVFNNSHEPTGNIVLRPGPLNLSLDNRTNMRALPVVWIAGDALNGLLEKRRPYLTAKRLLTNQTFRDIYRTDTLNVDQGLKILNLTFLFTDLKGSTELYERVGDLVAYELVRAHFHVLNEIVASESGAVVKTIGDAVMATFPTPDRALAAALRMREAIRAVGNKSRREDLLLKIGIHEGPCLAVMLNERLDYFGQTVNIAARVQGLASSRAIFATKPIVEHPLVSRLLESSNIQPAMHRVSLKGIAEQVTVYEIP